MSSRDVHADVSSQKTVHNQLPPQNVKTSVSSKQVEAQGSSQFVENQQIPQRVDSQKSESKLPLQPKRHAPGRPTNVCSTISAKGECSKSLLTTSKENEQMSELENSGSQSLCECY